MTEHTDHLNELNKRFIAITRQQQQLNTEIESLRVEINRLRNMPEQMPAKEIATPLSSSEKVIQSPIIEAPITQKKSISTQQHSYKRPAKTVNLEKFLGENLISKIGIAITIIGVVIGIRYSIENQLISPLWRILLAALFGAGLLGTGLKLKTKYINYSAILVSGAAAIWYFSTYAAYDFYALIPQTAAFGLMVVFTILLAFTAILYNQQIIAHIGMIGAYTIPFLLSNNEGNVAFLFTYMGIINAGLLIIAFKKMWKPIYYTTFAATWIIFLTWYFIDYKNDHFAMALVFGSLFFILFYTTFIAYTTLHKDKLNAGNLIIWLLNVFIFYGVGLNCLLNHEVGQHFQGLFTLLNASIHLGVAMLIYKHKNVDATVRQFTTGLVITFITLTIPVQLSANWITLLWILEATVLLWLANKRNHALFFYFSMALITMALFSLAMDWKAFYHLDTFDMPTEKIVPFFNLGFLTNAIFIACLAYMSRLLFSTDESSTQVQNNQLAPVMKVVLPGLLLIVSYLLFFFEIETYYNQQYNALKIALTDSKTLFNHDILRFKYLYEMCYTMLFAGAMNVLAEKVFKTTLFAQIALFTSLAVSFIVLAGGLPILGELRDSYLNQPHAHHFNCSAYHIAIRYILFIFLGGMLFTLFKLVTENSKTPFKSLKFRHILHPILLWMLSNELIYWLHYAGSQSAYKYGLTIFWGAFALVIIAQGIYLKDRTLRIGALGLLGITLGKLFFYDTSNLSTISKTIVFVSVGLLFLIISFLYTKYKHKLWDDDEHEADEKSSAE